MISAPTERLHRKPPASGASLIHVLRSSYGAKEILDRQDSYVSRFVYRPISFVLTVPFARMGCSANQITILRSLLALLSTAFVATGRRSLVVVGASLYAFCVLLDYVDGNLARLCGTAGDLGGFLEELADQVGPSLFPFAVGIGLFSRPDHLMRSLPSVDPLWALLTGAVASMAYCLSATATLYVRAIAVRLATPSGSKPRMTISTDRSDSLRVALFHLVERALTEGVYLAIVFGIVLAAALNLMSIYLLARTLRNLAVLFLRVRRLITRLSEVSSETRF